MSIERAEQLKKELTDKWVVVKSGIPELRRFEKLTGQVRTVNMNCRALVQFDGPEDIGWYDIDPSCLTVVDGPRPKEKPAAPEKKKPAATKKAAAPATGGASPLDQIRAQSAPTAKPAAGGSPLDQIRAQAAGGSKSAAQPAAASGASPLDQIRAQNQAAAQDTPADSDPPAETPPEPAADDASPAPEPPPAAESKPKIDTSGMSPLDIIRAQGAFKGNGG